MQRQEHSLPLCHALINIAVHQNIQRESYNRHAGVVIDHFVAKRALTECLGLTRQRSAQSFVQIVPHPRRAVIEKILVVVTDVFGPQIPGQALIQRTFLLCRQAESVLPYAAPLGLIAPQFPGWWRHAQLIIHDAARKIGGEPQIANAGIEQPPVEDQVGVGRVVDNTQGSMAEVIPDIGANIDSNQIELKLVQIVRDLDVLPIFNRGLCLCDTLRKHQHHGQ